MKSVNVKPIVSSVRTRTAYQRHEQTIRQFVNFILQPVIYQAGSPQPDIYDCFPRHIILLVDR